MPDARSDDELVREARAGDADAFRRLLARHYATIHRIAWKWCGDPTEAEDVAQEVAIRLARSISGFDGRARFTTWLAALTINAARDALRRNARERARRDGWAMLAPVAIEEDDSVEALWQAVRALPEKERDAVMLVHSEGMSHAEAAAVLGVREVTVSWRIHQARRRLRVELGAAAHA